MQRVVLVTGTSSGIGREAVHHLVRAGHAVVATARDPGSIEDLRGPAVDTLRLDVTDDRSVADAVAHALDAHGRIDAVVNNAGFGAFLPVEETPVEAYRAMLEVNLLGAHRVALRVLPHMRERGSGRIVNVSSIAGHVGFPMIGAYSSTKFALRGLSQAMAAELRPFGIHVSLVEPGSIRTSFGARAQREQQAHGADLSGPYAPMHRRFDRLVGGRGRAHPRVVARRIVHACTARRPRFHYLAPWDARSVNAVKHLLPDAVVNAVLRRAFWP